MPRGSAEGSCAISADRSGAPAAGAAAALRAIFCFALGRALLSFSPRFECQTRSRAPATSSTVRPVRTLSSPHGTVPSARACSSLPLKKSHDSPFSPRVRTRW